MIRRLKMIGLAAVAATAFTAVAVASASAAEFHSASSTTYVKGTQSTENVFTVSGGTVKCTGAEFKTNAAEGANPISGTTASSVTVHPTYSGCKAFGQNATVVTTGCNYVLTVSGATSGAVDIVCSGSNQIVVTANTAGCTVKVADHTPTTPTVEYANQESNSSILVTSKVEGITYTSSGGICGASGSAGKYTGTVLTKGYSDEGFTTATSIWVE